MLPRRQALVLATNLAFLPISTSYGGCGQKVGHSGVRIGVRMYPLQTRELAVEAVAAGFSVTEAAELAGCSRTAAVNWEKAAGVSPPPRKKAAHLPFDRKMELVARREVGEWAADFAEEAGVTASAVSGWRRRLREEGALSLVADPRHRRPRTGEGGAG